VTDDWPSIEYATWVRRGEFSRVLTEVLAVQAPVPIAKATDDFTRMIRSEREALMHFYQAGLAAYRGDRDAWKRWIQEAIRAEPDNAYFRWLVSVTE
jgi:spermidine synthase